MMPRRLVLVRHGKSEANKLTDELDDNPYDQKLREIAATIPNWKFRLTDSGIQQAKAAGRWLRGLKVQFGAAFASNFVRARETAGYALIELQQEDLRLTDEEARVGERHWGDFASLSPEQREEQYRRRKEDSRYWSGPGGEMLLDVEVRAWTFFDMLHRQHSDQNVLVFSHGEFITVACSLLEKWSNEEIGSEIKRGVPNGGIVIYSRYDAAGVEHHKYVSRLRYCPANAKWKDGSFGDPSWHPLQRKGKRTPEELLKEVERYPRQF